MDADVRGRSGLDSTILRPGHLTDDPGSGMVTLAESTGNGSVSRDDVAAVIVGLLDEPRTIGQTLELISGNASVEAAVAKLLTALRALDARVVEQLAERQAQSCVRGVQSRSSGEESEGGDGGLSVPARALLKFSTPRDPGQLAAFINLRVLNPEHAHWRRGIEAAALYARIHGDLKVPFTYRVPAADDQEAQTEGWPASLAHFPLGQWIADARRFYARGDLDADRVAQLEKLGMVLSHFDVAWEEGLAAAHGWAAEHGHLLAPLDATYQGYRVGIWLKNQRAAARKAAEAEQRRAEGLPVQSAAGALAEVRREQLEDIDPSWCPAWPVEWQRAFHLVRLHLDAGLPLPTAPGDVVRQGEDLGRWVRSVRLGWNQLTTVQQWMCEQILGIEPAGEDEKPKPRRTQADKWAMNYQAAKQFYEREGHLQVPRKHVERTIGEDQEERELKLGAWIGNQRSRAAMLSPERVEQLSAIGMRWA
ncbi:Helicase associated domain protein [Streptomyces sp. AN-3]|uniref:Helicase associated domain protein n=1 Tax=Streptomyces sp. AN-3 TaxID=3044177 RepID=UPI00249CBFD6|nr:Helicase associated domain protein [Streptomyces sp. AN-3]MDI3101941.1 Helicase associated domain protein [Streptomyces sp. AN-3]